MSSYSHNSYLKKYSPSEITSNPDFDSTPSLPNHQKGKIIDISLKELDNVRKFLLNYE